MADAISAATIAAVDRHLAHLGLCPGSDSAGLAPVAPPPPRRTGVVDPTTHSSAPVRYSVAAPAPLQYTSAGLAPVAQPPSDGRVLWTPPHTLRSRTVLCCGPCSLTVHFRGRRPCSSAPPPRRTGVVGPTTHSSARVRYSAAAPAPLQYTSAGLAPVAQSPPTDGCCGPFHALLAPLQYSAALQPLAPATSAVLSPPTASQRQQTPAPATANLATFVAHAALQPLAPATSRFQAPPLRPCGP